MKLKSKDRITLIFSYLKIIRNDISESWGIRAILYFGTFGFIYHTHYILKVGIDSIDFSEGIGYGLQGILYIIFIARLYNSIPKIFKFENNIKKYLKCVSNNFQPKYIKSRNGEVFYYDNRNKEIVVPNVIDWEKKYNKQLFREKSIDLLLNKTQ